MSGIAIYMEGGGDRISTRAEIRIGMEQFLHELKDLARAKSMHWKLIPLGGRDQVFKEFHSHPADPNYPIRILLVDAETAMTATDKRSHLHEADGWDLAGTAEDHVHLMIQTMETWIVADPEALEQYYGKKFKRSALPARGDLEEEPKLDCANKLAIATRNTQKGEYRKLRHGADLLGRISPAKVRRRCRHAEIMFSDLLRLIG